MGDDRIRSFGDRTLLTAVASLIWENDLRPAGWRAVKPSAAQAKAIVDEHAELLDLRTDGRRLTPFMIRLAAIYGAFVATKEHKRLGRVWLEHLERGAGTPARQPITRLRRRLADVRKAGARRREQMETSAKRGHGCAAGLLEHADGR